jgi:hypothetical protein
MSKNLFTDVFKSWANIMNENSANKRKTRRNRSANRNKEGDTKGEGKNMMIYTKKPITNIRGVTKRGSWVKAVDPEGDYGGPYANLRQLLNNSKYKSDQANIEKSKAAYTEYKKTRRSASRSSSRSKSQRK